MTKENIIAEYTLLGTLIAHEAEIATEIIEKTAEQRKVHQQVLSQRDVVNHLNEDKEV